MTEKVTELEKAETVDHLKEADRMIAWYLGSPGGTMALHAARDHIKAAIADRSGKEKPDHLERALQRAREVNAWCEAVGPTALCIVHPAARVVDYIEAAMKERENAK